MFGKNKKAGDVKGQKRRKGGKAASAKRGLGKAAANSENAKKAGFDEKGELPELLKGEGPELDGSNVAEADLDMDVDEDAVNEALIAAKREKAPKGRVSGRQSSFRFNRKRTEKEQIEEKAASEKEARRLSSMVAIEFQAGVEKQDAIEWGKRWALTNMPAPENCYYHVQKWGSGWAIEVQEGVGKAYLPSVIKLAQANPGRVVTVPMSRRLLTVIYIERDDDFVARLLPENTDPPLKRGQTALRAVRSVPMKPVKRQHRSLMLAGSVMAALSSLFLLASVGVYAVDPAAKVPPEWKTTPAANLPVMQWPRLQADSTDSYVVRMEYSDGSWRIVRQSVGATTNVVAPMATGPQEIVGGAVPSASPEMPVSPATQP